MLNTLQKHADNLNTILDIEGEEADGAESKERLLDALEHRFAGLEDDELMMQIKEIARGHLSGN